MGHYLEVPISVELPTTETEGAATKVLGLFDKHLYITGTLTSCSYTVQVSPDADSSDWHNVQVVGADGSRTTAITATGVYKITEACARIRMDCTDATTVSGPVGKLQARAG
jgi:hypothetical protein